MKDILLRIVIIFLPFTTAAQTYMLTGTYTSGSAKGIYVYSFDKKMGSTVLVDSIITPNPSYLVISQDKRFVYSTNQPDSNKQGAVSAYSFKDGHLQKKNSQSSGGDGPCYVSIDKSGKWLAVANYFAGTFSILPIQKDGSLGKADTTIVHTGSSVNIIRQDKAHAHCCEFSPDNKYLFVMDFGMDKIMIYSFDEETGKINSAQTPFVQTVAGAGPRHLIFHPNKKFAYLIQELSGKVEVYGYSGNGDLQHWQTISSLPGDFTGTIGAADIHISPNGKLLYVSNRGDANSITAYSINKKGMLTWVGCQSTLGKKPRNFNIDPSGKYLIAANQDSNEIVIFKIDKKNGSLSDTGNRISVGNPVCIKWIE